LVKVVEGASWHVWPNGHPVVRVIPKRDIDVVDLAEKRRSWFAIRDARTYAINGHSSPVRVRGRLG
jgi:hypothetical protein